MVDDDGWQQHDPRALLLKGVLLVAWAGVTFVCCWFARDLQFPMGPWRFSYWMAAQGAMLAFLAIVVVYAWAMNRIERQHEGQAEESRDV